MIVRPTSIPGMLVIESTRIGDSRGSFQEIYQERLLAERGWAGRFVRSAISHNAARGTLRGMHFQRAPHADAKLVSCVRGRVFDVAADIRPDSPRFGAWEGVELSEENATTVLLPEGVAHGFVTLTDDAAVMYQIGAYYEPGVGAGIRWDDPTLAIAWPVAPTVISDQDRSWGWLPT